MRSDHAFRHYLQPAFAFFSRSSVSRPAGTFAFPASMRSASVLSIATGIGPACLLLLIAIAGGMFVVPLYAFLTTKCDPAQAARMVAANNIVNSGAMVVGSLLAIGISLAGVATADQLLLAAAMCVLSAWLG